jgi:hypothetical protein
MFCAKMRRFQGMVTRNLLQKEMGGSKIRPPKLAFCYVRQATISKRRQAAVAASSIARADSTRAIELLFDH